MEVPHRGSAAGPAPGGGELEHDLKDFDRWAAQGVWERVLERTQSIAQHAAVLDWVASVDSTIVRSHPYGATLPRLTGCFAESQEVRGGAG